MDDTFKFVCTDGEFSVSKRHFNVIGGLFLRIKDGTYMKVKYTVSQMKEAWFIICDATLATNNRRNDLGQSTSLNLPYSLYPIFDMLKLPALTRWQSYIGMDYEYVGICRWLLHDHDDMPQRLVADAVAGLRQYMRDNLDYAIEILRSDGVGPDLAIAYYIATGICNTYGLVEKVIYIYYEKYDVDDVDEYFVNKLNIPPGMNEDAEFDVNDVIIGGVDQYRNEFFEL